MQNSILNHYSSNIISIESGLLKKQRYNTYLFLLRFITFLSLPLFLYLYIKSGYNSLFLITSILGLVSFIVALNLDSVNNFKLKFLKNKLQVNNAELKYLDHKFQEFKTGEEFQSLNPHLADDFDIFGLGSVFQYLNRCSTKIGEHKLAELLCSSNLNKKIISERQTAIKELSEKTDFIQNFQSYGMFFSENGDELRSLQTWLDDSAEKLKWLRVLSIAVPIVNFIWIALVVVGTFSISSLLTPVLLSLSIVFFNHKIINNAHVKLGNTAKTFGKYNDLILLIEKENFKSSVLHDLKDKLSSNEIKASESLKYLNKLLNRFDIRYNVIVSFLLNSLVIFDIQIFIRLAKWKEKHKAIVPSWFNSLAETDALISFAVFAFNNKETVSYPEISEKDFYFYAKEIGHPILHPKLRICNDIEFSGTPSALVITGANMAGKSTFLRTISVNLILAMNGAPVCAKQFSFTPCDIMSSIKIQDSLFKNESYFYAELLRIKEIIEHSKVQPKTIVILDEILRGTNTKDKQTGSLGIIEKLISQKSVVIVATHDLVIGDLEKKHPGIVVNHCFEVELTNDQLIFDYKLKKGISQKMNASFLMKKLDIID